MTNISAIQFSDLKRASNRKVSIEESPYLQSKDAAWLHDQRRASKAAITRGIDEGTDDLYARRGAYCEHCGRKEDESPAGWHRDEINEWRDNSMLLRNRGLSAPGIDLGDKSTRAAYGEWRKSKGLDVAAAHLDFNDNLKAPELLRIARQSSGNR